MATTSQEYTIERKTGDNTSEEIQIPASSVVGLADTKVKNAEHADTADTATSAGSADTAANATNVTTNINGKAISSIFESDGTTVKEATSAGTADKVSSPFSVNGSTATKTDISTQYNGLVPRKLFFNSNDFYLAQEGSTVAQFPEGLSAHLRPTGVTAGQYSAVNVDAKGRVTAGGKSIEWGTSGQTKPSDDLMVGGLFMELQS